MNKDGQYAILTVDDAKDSLMLLDFDLSESGYQVFTAESGEQALLLLEDITVDLILLDMHMPGMSGLSLLELLKSTAAYKDIPVIMLSASGQEEAIVSALEMGADDYVTKPYIPRVLLARIRNSLRFMEKTKQLEVLAKTDSLTRLNNRGSFNELTNAALSQAKRSNQPISIAMFDLDHFKRVNDNYGHEAGDLALVEFANIMKDCFRDYDVIGRVGGEEFAVCMPETDIDDAFLACERCRTTLEKHAMKIEHQGKLHEFTLTVSIGISAQTEQSLSFEQLLRRADNALYSAKQSGRNQSILDEDVKGSTNNMAIDANELMSSVTSDVNTDDSNAYPGINYSIGVKNVLGDDALFEEILVMFYQDHGQDKQHIANAINDKDYASLKSLVHTLKGVACSIGAMNLFEYCKALDVAINTQNDAQYAELFSPVEKELETVIEGIVKNLSEKL